MAANSREARRRRLLEQGSDRLALIKGRIHTLPSQPSKPPESDADIDAAASSSSQPQPQPQPQPQLQPLISDDQPIRPHFSDQNSTGVSPCGEVEDSDSILPNQNPVSDSFPSDAYKSRSLTPLDQREGENSSVPDSEVERSQTKEPKLFSSSEINCAISASLRTRLCCSVAVALLVVVSHLRFSVICSKFITSIISFRPLYLVLVTNLTVMVARLLSSKQRGFERAERRENKTSDGDHWAQQLSKTLELGLVMKNVIDAIFMDCAIYVIIVICGLSVVQA